MPRRKPCRFESGLAHHLDRSVPVRVRPRAAAVLRQDASGDGAAVLIGVFSNLAQLSAAEFVFG